MTELAQKVRLGFVTRLKQGDLLKALRDRNWSQADAARYFGVTSAEFGTWINLRKIRRTFTEDQQRKFLLLTGKLPEELFPEFVRTEQFQDAPRSVDVYRDLTPDMLETYGEQLTLPSPEDLLIEKEAEQEINRALAWLSPREEQVLRMRMDGWAFTEIGAHFAVGGTRIRQIFDKAMEKLEREFGPKPPPPDPLDLAEEQWKRMARAYLKLQKRVAADAAAAVES